MVQEYFTLLDRIKDHLQREGVEKVHRMELPRIDLVWVGNKTTIRNFKQIADILRREPQRLLVFLGRELATATNMDNEGRAFLAGRKDPESIRRVIARFYRDYVVCPVCGSPDTKLVRERKITFLVCEACGARTPVREIR